MDSSVLTFLREVLEKNHIRTVCVSPMERAAVLFDRALLEICHRNDVEDMTVGDYLGKIESVTRYTVTDRSRISFVYMALPNREDDHILVIGPYLSAHVTEEEILEMGEMLGVRPSKLKLLEKYYFDLPVMQEHDRLYSILDTFCEQIWSRPSFAIVNKGVHEDYPASPIHDISKDGNDEDILLNISVMEKRYAFENELIRAVTLGQQHKESILSISFHDQMFEHRAKDPVRNAKNYSIIMNTLLRKAAEQGGVHPLYIDRVSSRFAFKIEQVESLRENAELMKQMFTAYCRLVYHHSMKQYSPIVKKTVLIIDSDLSAELTTHMIAEQIGVTPQYLSTLFRKEVGLTVTEFIRDRRMKHAMYLLSTTKLQIQTVAAHCGIMDVQYFSKMFKKHVGKSPKDYRDTAK